MKLLIAFSTDDGEDMIKDHAGQIFLCGSTNPYRNHIYSEGKAFTREEIQTKIL